MTTDIAATFPPGEPANVVKLLTQQCDLYRRLNDLSSQQSSLIADGAAEQLLSVLAQRQGLVDSLTQINDKLAVCRQRWADISKSLNQPQRDHLNGLLEQVQSLLQSIIAQDDKDRQQLQLAQQQVGTELKQVARAGAAVTAYRAAPPAAVARFTDRRG
jgi:hypothetical protein